MFYNCYFSDIDECFSVSDNNCDQECINTFGSFECGCGEGYILDTDGTTCLGKCGEMCPLDLYGTTYEGQMQWR